MQPLTAALSLALCALSACTDAVPPAPRHAGHDLLHHDGDWGDGGRGGGAGRWQDSGYFQGDIMLPANASARNGLLSAAARWPNRVMPYYIDPTFTAAQRAVIESAVADYNARTCVTMRPYRSGDSRYIWIKGDNTGCWSYVGAQGGVTIQFGATSSNVVRTRPPVPHASLHSQVHITVTRAGPGRHGAQLRDKLQRQRHQTLAWTYDTGSIMHYDAYAFSKNGQKTIVAPRPIGQNSGFSSSDILKLEKMYGCR
ncbi:Seminal metalloprotease 1 [Gryllus bimaculatus]|nr:Seminal metalloprotease 1 [Gryllus bimaculatus]